MGVVRIRRTALPVGAVVAPATGVHGVVRRRPEHSTRCEALDAGMSRGDRAFRLRGLQWEAGLEPCDVAAQRLVPVRDGGRTGVPSMVGLDRTDRGEQGPGDLASGVDLGENLGAPPVSLESHCRHGASVGPAPGHRPPALGSREAELGPGAQRLRGNYQRDRGTRQAGGVQKRGAQPVRGRSR